MTAVCSGGQHVSLPRRPVLLQHHDWHLTTAAQREHTANDEQGATVARGSYLVVRALEQQLPFKRDDSALFSSLQRAHQRLQRLLALIVVKQSGEGARKLTCKQ